MVIESSGELLERWLDQPSTPPQHLVAERVGRSTTAIANWKHRGIPADSVTAIDSALNARGVFEQMNWAASTPQWLSPATAWDCNFPEFSRPAWIWVRPVEPGTLRIRFRCGIVESRFELNLGRDGVLFRTPIAIANPPVRIQASAPFWMDHGTGEPPRLGGLPVIEVIRPTREAHESDDYAALWADNLKRNSRRKLSDLAGILGTDTSAVRRFFERRRSPTSVQTVESFGDLDHLDLGLLKRIREIRGLSLAETAVRVSALSDEAFSRDQLYRLEAERVEVLPLQTKVLPALDQVLGARGRGGPYLESTWADASHVEWQPHSWWNGDLWFHCSHPGTLRLHRGWYQKTVVIETAGSLLTTRNGDSNRPFRLRYEPGGSSISFGYGRPPAAVDINDRWSPSSRQALRQTMRWGEELTVRLFQDGDPRDQRVFY